MLPIRMKPFYRTSLHVLPFTFLSIAFGSVGGAAQQPVGGERADRLTANEFSCGIAHPDRFCLNVATSPIDAGGLWPRGTPNSYVFQWSTSYAARIAGPVDHAWAADTVGGYMAFPAFGAVSASPLTGIWDSTDQLQRASWPSAGFHPLLPDLSGMVDDETLYRAHALGTASASEQDTWQAYWDGVPPPPVKSGPPRTAHPGGVLIDVRTLAWNYPRGNESNLYFVFRLTNVSANPEFQLLQEERYFGGADSLPEQGWTLTGLHFAVHADPDVTFDARRNFASAVVPFAMGVAYRSDFVAPEFEYVPHIFHPPFLERAPGIVGFTFARSPAAPSATANGLAIMSAITGGGAFSDPYGAPQILRYLSGDVRQELGDPTCLLDDPRQRHLCYLLSSEADARFYQSTGPIELPPGGSETVVVVVTAAATVDVPGIEPGVSNPPRVTATEPSPHPGCFGHEITTIERAAGWLAGSRGSRAPRTARATPLRRWPRTPAGRCTIPISAPTTWRGIASTAASTPRAGRCSPSSTGRRPVWSITSA